MKVLWDLSYVSSNFFGGVELYSGDAIAGFKENGDLAQYTFLVRESAKDALMQLTDGQAKYILIKNSCLIDWIAKRGGHIGSFVAKCFYSGHCVRRILPKICKDYDAFIQPYGRVQNARVTCMPVVLVIHDILFYHTGRPGSIYYNWNDWWMKHIPGNTKRIVTISEFVKRDILKAYPQISQPIEVIPNAVDVVTEHFSHRLLPEPYIFSASVFLPHKNQITLLRAYAKIADKIEHKLVFLGRQEKGMEQIQDFVERNNLKNRVVFYTSVSEMERNSLYHYADLFVTTSKNEGFGRTPVEAAIFKIPVISTKVTSLEEVTLGLLNYYDPPTDVDALADKIIAVLSNPPSQQQLQDISMQLTNAYTKRQISRKWETCLEHTISENTNR